MAWLFSGRDALKREIIPCGEPGMKYRIQTYGCQMNVHDSEILAGQLERMGFEEAQGIEDADLLLLNTCTVRETAAQKVMGEIGRLKTVKVLRPELLIGVCGCMAQEEERVKEIQRYHPHVDLLFGTHNLHRLPELVARAREERESVVDVWQSAGEVVEHLPAKRAEGVRAWVTIIYGCDKFCTYCIVPHTRGRERSRRPESIIAEVEGLASRGYREITLLGQNVNSYGHDLGTGYLFGDLLRDLNAVPGIRWIRYMTSHPRDFPRKLVDTIAGLEKVCEHFHLPVQAGSDEVLRRMNRRYTRAEYLDLVGHIYGRIPGASVTTDIIVGFPGETAADFGDTLDVVRQARFDNAFMFVYSPRRGTPAARWEDPVPIDEKKRRLQELMDLQYAISLEKNQALVGSQAEVLIDGPSKKDPHVLSGRTRTNKLVLLPPPQGEPPPGGSPRGVDVAGPAAWAGRFVQARITGAQTWALTAQILPPEPAADR